jgi:hypothetical protein
MSHKLKDLGRRSINFRKRSVKEVLPEYFTAEYPDFVQMLEYYYDFLDSDGQHAFDTEIFQLNTIRDIGETPTEYLNLLINETTSLQGGGLFKEPRFTMRRFAESYRNKGSRFSLEEFFQAFYQQSAEVEYPKKDIFIVADSKIGYDSQKYIQNNAKYQIFSILVKVGLGTSQYETLYKKFVHPAGFYFEGEVIIEDEANLNLDIAQIPSEEAFFVGTIQSEATIAPEIFTSMTGLVDSDSRTYRYDLTTLISAYSTVTAADLDAQYDSIAQLVTPNSFTMDDSDVIRPSLDNTIETMDNDMFTRYLSDSSY